MESANYCSACLITGVKMHSSNFIDDRLLQLLCFPPNSNGETHFCFECSAYLQKFEKFKSKCTRAQELLSKLEENYQITAVNIQNVDRKEHQLISTITQYSLDSITIDSTQNNSGIKDLTAWEVKPSLELLNNVTVISQIKDETKYPNSPLHDYDDQINDFDINDSSTGIPQNDINKELKTKKEHKSKKRKASTKESFEFVSDDEPLASKVSQTHEGSENNGFKKYNRGLKYLEDYATVEFLSPEDAKNELLLRKESSNFINSPFKCQFCYRGFEAKATFDNHMKKHSNESGEYECEICHLRFLEQRGLCKHRLTSHKRKFTCKLCSYVCFCTSQAKNHISLHKGKKYPCKECGEIFSMPNSLLMHRRQKHVTECVCDFCGNTFATARGLYLHRVKIHRQEENGKLGPNCKECDIHFATEEAWKLHLVLSSKHNVSNGCKYCGESFPSHEALKGHMAVHSRRQRARSDLPKLPTSCSICNKYLLNLAEYKSHMSSAHPRSDITKKLEMDSPAPFVCETCGMAFKKQCFLKYHQRRHSGERPYACAHCGKCFPLAGALAAHRAVHARRAHACTVCDRLFTFKSALNKHMKVHLNIRPHCCDICDKSFINPCDVRLHIKYVHNKVPWPKRDRTKKLPSTNTQ